MPLQITIDLEDQDLQFFYDAAKRAQQKAANLTAQQITEAAGKLLVESKDIKVPAFIAERLSKLDAMINMVSDTGWGLTEDDRQRVLSSLIYFAEPDDVIPDNVPVLGFLDDAIMIELCQRELQHEIEAYEDFVAYRHEQASRRGEDANQVKLQRVEWLEGRRQELQDRMRRRRSESFAPAQASAPMFRFT